MACNHSKSFADRFLDTHNLKKTRYLKTVIASEPYIRSKIQKQIQNPHKKFYILSSFFRQMTLKWTVGMYSQEHLTTDFWALYCTIPGSVGPEKTALRVFHFSIIIEKWNTAMVLKTSLQLVFFTKNRQKRHKKALYDKFAEVKVVYKTPRKD